MPIVNDQMIPINLITGKHTNTSVDDSGRLTLESSSPTTGTDVLDVNSYPVVIYVDGINGDDTAGNGGYYTAYKTVPKATSVATVENTLIFIISEGTYEIPRGIQSLLTTGTTLTYAVSKLVYGKVIFELQFRGHSIGIVMTKLNSFVGIIFRVASTVNNYYDNFSDSATINLDFYNCAFDSTNMVTQSFPILTGSSAGSKVTKLLYQNCTFQPLFVTNSTNAGVYNGTFTNCVHVKAGFTTQEFNLNGATIDSAYYVTAGAWSNVGSGTNKDGRQASLGVYGGIYSYPLSAFKMSGNYETPSLDLGLYLDSITSFTGNITAPEGATLNIYTSTSADNDSFSPYVLINGDGTINSPQQRYIKMKFELQPTSNRTLTTVQYEFLGNDSNKFFADNQLDFSGYLEIKSIFPETMQLVSILDNGKLFKATINKSQFISIQGIGVN
jgi:hypothetical protein